MRYKLIDLVNTCSSWFIDNMEVDEHELGRNPVLDVPALRATDIGDVTYIIDAEQVVELKDGECEFKDTEGDTYYAKFVMERPMQDGDLFEAGVSSLAPCPELPQTEEVPATEAVVLEVQGAGFDGGTDETDDRILWVTCAVNYVDALRGIASLYGAKVVEIDHVKPGHEGIDFSYPEETVQLSQRLRDIEQEAEPLVEARRLWSPMEVRVLLHYYYSPDNWVSIHGNSEAFDEAFNRWLALGCIEERDDLPPEIVSGITVTARGRALIERWLSQPLPQGV